MRHINSLYGRKCFPLPVTNLSTNLVISLTLRVTGIKSLQSHNFKQFHCNDSVYEFLRLEKIIVEFPDYQLTDINLV